MNLNIVSFGAGVNSTAMIIYMYHKNIKIDDIIFCDPGNEMPKTYEFIPIFEKWCLDHKLKFTKIKSHLGTIKDYYFSRNLIPSRMFRHCTDKFKIRPIYKYLKETYEKNTHVNMYLGIASDEAHRAKESGVKKRTMIYPLVDNDIDRNACIDLIKHVGMKVPVKSGCYFCPFQPKQEWVNLYKIYPKLFDDSIEFEKNCKEYPEFKLANKTLESIKDVLKTQTKLDDFLEDPGIEQCVFCHL